jgi:hypothetical protein
MITMSDKREESTKSIGSKPDSFGKLLESIDSKLNELIAYERFRTFPRLRELLPKMLDSPEKRIVFQACDGKSGINEIARGTNVIPMNVSNWIRKFESQGIILIITHKNKKCPLRIVNLKDIGIAVPRKSRKDNKGERNG